MTSPNPDPTAPAPVIQQLALDRLQESPFNNRKHYDPAELNSLAESIKKHGVQQPILVRPATYDQHEIVYGSRRYRASKIAGVPTIPSIVRSMTDEEAMELMLIENVQREGISELEEAQGFQQILDLNKKLVNVLGDTPKHTADTIAERIGKSREYVYGRLKLLNAGKKATKAFTEGKLSAGHLVQIARRPIPEQEAAVAEIQQAEKDGRPMSVKELGRYLASRYLDLRMAPFDRADAELLPKAGACTACPKFSGKNPEVLADLSPNERNPFTCTDRSCYNEKLEALWVRKEAEVKAATGKTPQRISCSHSDVAGALRQGEWKPVSPKKTCPHIHLGLIVAAESYEAERLGTVVEICTEKKCKVHGDYQYREMDSTPKAAAQRLPFAEEENDKRLIQAIVAGTRDPLRLAAKLYFENANVTGITQVQIGGCPPAKLPRLFLEMVLQDDAVRPQDVAKRLGIKVPPVQTSTQAKARAPKAKKSGKAKKVAKAKPTKKAPRKKGKGKKGGR